MERGLLNLLTENIILKALRTKCIDFLVMRYSTQDVTIRVSKLDAGCMQHLCTIFANFLCIYNYFKTERRGGGGEEVGKEEKEEGHFKMSRKKNIYISISLLKKKQRHSRKRDSLFLKFWVYCAFLP